MKLNLMFGFSPSQGQDKTSLLLRATVLVGALGGLAYADPPSSILHAVTLKTSSGTLSGFTAYESGYVSKLNAQKNKGRRSSEWVIYRPTDGEIKSFLFDTYSLPLYRTIHKVPFPREMIVTTSKIMKFRQGDVQAIYLSSHPLNGFTWYGMVNHVEEATAKLLQTKPHFMCGEQRDGCCTHYTWVSYNGSVGEAELRPFCSGPFDIGFEDRAKGFLKTPNVFRLGESTD